jgi:urease beta subunit
MTDQRGGTHPAEEAAGGGATPTAGSRPLRPGEVIPAPGERILNEDRPVRVVVVTNTSRRTVWVSSHYPFARVNPRLVFDRRGLETYHLDIPAGDAVRWRPGETKTVRLVGYAGRLRPPAAGEAATAPSTADGPPTTAGEP